MELATTEPRTQMARVDEYTEIDVRQLPIVSIGQPEIWHLKEFYSAEKIPPLLKAKSNESDFYLVRFACSFRPRQEDNRIAWARFLVHLLPDEIGHQPIAYDLYPLMVTQEVKRNVRITLSPTLKFLEIGATAGELAFGFEYTEIQPIISAAGAGEPTPSWDYAEATGMAVQGSKFMHLLLQVPLRMKNVKAFLEIAADVKVPGSVLAVLGIRDKKKASDHLTVRLVSR